MDLSKAQNIFLIGIKGVAMAGLAVIFKKMGKNVTGVDTDEEQITDELLKKHSISYKIGFDKENLPQETDFIIYSAAHGGQENPLVQSAQKKGISTMNQAEFLGKLLEQFKTSVAVTGTHGKTTTSALLSYALINLGLSPSYLIGAPSFSGKDGADYGKQEYFVIEADEYAADPPKDKTVKFLHLNPSYILVTNVDFDHPDVFDSLDEVKKVFSAFFKDRQVFACADDVNLMSVVTRTHTKALTTYGFAEDSDIRIGEIIESQDKTTFKLFEKGEDQGEFTIKIFGKKNVSNTAGVYAILRHLGYASDKIKAAIADFSGAKRRFEEKFKLNSNYLFDDYAHHPEEIKAVLEAARSRFPNHKIIVLFQSHTYSRTKALLSEFAESLSYADYAIIAPIFSSAREKKEDFNVGPQDIEMKAKEKGKTNVVATETMNEVLKKLKDVLASNQVIFTMGAGSIYTLDRDIIKLLKNTAPAS